MESPREGTEDSMTERLLCLSCSNWTDADETLTSCPNCGSRGVPASSEDTVEVKVTWHELRVLVIWAKQWANRNKSEHDDMSRVVYGIADRLYQQHLARPPLTLAGEITDLKEKFPDVETHGIPGHEDGEL